MLGTMSFLHCALLLVISLDLMSYVDSEGTIYYAQFSVIVISRLLRMSRGNFSISFLGVALKGLQSTTSRAFDFSAPSSTSSQHIRQKSENCHNSPNNVDI